MTELGGIGFRSDQYLTHTFSVANFGNPLTSVQFAQDELVTQIDLPGAVIPCCARLECVGVDAATLGINSPGNWTLRIRDIGSSADLATFDFAVPLALTVTCGPPNPCIKKGCDSYYVIATGPSRNAVVARATLLWRLL